MLDDTRTVPCAACWTLRKISLVEGLVLRRPMRWQRNARPSARGSAKFSRASRRRGGTEHPGIGVVVTIRKRADRRYIGDVQAQRVLQSDSHRVRPNDRDAWV